MLYFNRFGISEGIDINKTSAPNKCDICHYWYFLDKDFKFQPHVCNGCYDVLIMSMNVRDIVILKIHGVDYRCIINGMSKSETMGLLDNVNPNEKSGILYDIKIDYHV